MPTAIIAEDEPELARDLATRLKALWPEIEIVALCPNGLQAAMDIERLKPDVAFVDVRMPGIDGLEVAKTAGDTRVVFVTAYEEHAVAAFETNAIDYLLKPVSDSRLAKCVMRLQREDAARRPVTPAAVAPASRLSWFTVEDGTVRRLVHVNDVIYLQARDKYTTVVTRDARYTIQTSLKELLTRLDTHVFVQIHRSTILNVTAVERFETQLFGRLLVHLRDHPDVLTVSRSFVSRFRPL